MRLLTLKAPRMALDPTQMMDPAAGAPTDGGAEAPETITITPDGQGGWSVDDGADGDGPTACASIGDVMKAVHDCLSGVDDASDNTGAAKSAWADEASKRPDAGPPAKGGAPQMTMP